MHVRQHPYSPDNARTLGSTWKTTHRRAYVAMHMSGVQTSLLLQMPCRIQIEPANWVETAYDHCQHRTSSPPSTILGGRQSLQAGNVAWYNSIPVASGLWPGKKGAVATKSSQNKGEVASGAGGRPFGGLRVSGTESAGLWAGIPLGPYKTTHEVASTWAVEPPCSRAPQAVVCEVLTPLPALQQSTQAPAL